MGTVLCIRCRRIGGAVHLCFSILRRLPLMVGWRQGGLYLEPT
jgi:hypothetical protein